MSHVKVSSNPGIGKTSIEIDGQPLKDVTRVQLDFPADAIPEVHLGVAITRPFEFEGDAQVNLHLHVPEGCRLIEVTTHETAGKKFMVTKVNP
jgi:hypothetical protein